VFLAAPCINVPILDYTFCDSWRGQQYPAKTC